MPNMDEKAALSRELSYRRPESSIVLESDSDFNDDEDDHVVYTPRDSLANPDLPPSYEESEALAHHTHTPGDPQSHGQSLDEDLAAQDRSLPPQHSAHHSDITVFRTEVPPDPPIQIPIRRKPVNSAPQDERLQVPHSNAGNQASSVLQEALKFAENEAPNAERPILRTPVAVPSLARREGPIRFARFYAPVLYSHSVSDSHFADFVDGLNALSTACNFSVSIFHSHAALSETEVSENDDTLQSDDLVPAYIALSNTYFFNPRGLQVQLADLTQLADLLRITNAAIRKTILQEVLRMSRTSLDVPAAANGAAFEAAEALIPHVQVLTTAVPEPKKHQEALEATALRLANMGSGIDDTEEGAPAYREHHSSQRTGSTSAESSRSNTWADWSNDVSKYWNAWGERQQRKWTDWGDEKSRRMSFWGDEQGRKWGKWGDDQSEKWNRWGEHFGRKFERSAAGNSSFPVRGSWSQHDEEVRNAWSRQDCLRGFGPRRGDASFGAPWARRGSNHGWDTRMNNLTMVERGGRIWPPLPFEALSQAAVPTTIPPLPVHLPSPQAQLPHPPLHPPYPAYHSSFGLHRHTPHGQNVHPIFHTMSAPAVPQSFHPLQHPPSSPASAKDQDTNKERKDNHQGDATSEITADNFKEKDFRRIRRRLSITSLSSTSSSESNSSLHPVFSEPANIEEPTSLYAEIFAEKARHIEAMATLARSKAKRPESEIEAERAQALTLLEYEYMVRELKHQCALQSHETKAMIKDWKIKVANESTKYKDMDKEERKAWKRNAKNEWRAMMTQAKDQRKAAHKERLKVRKDFRRFVKEGKKKAHGGCGPVANTKSKDKPKAREAERDDAARPPVHEDSDSSASSDGDYGEGRCSGRGSRGRGGRDGRWGREGRGGGGRGGRGGRGRGRHDHNEDYEDMIREQRQDTDPSTGPAPFTGAGSLESLDEILEHAAQDMLWIVVTSFEGGTEA